MELNLANLAHCANTITRVVATGWKRSTTGGTKRFRSVASGTVPRTPHTHPLPLVEFRIALTRPDPTRGLHALAIYIDRDLFEAAGMRDMRGWHEYVTEWGEPNLWAVHFDEETQKVRTRVRRNRLAAETSLRITKAHLENGCIIKPAPHELYRLD